MTKQAKAATSRSRVVLPLLCAAVAGAVGLGLLLLMLGNAPMLVRLGLTGYVWYVLLILLGLAASISVFALFKSYARYSGRMLGGTLELGGPTVVMFLVVILGFRYVPAPLQRFDVTVFLHGEAGHQAVVLRNSGRLSLDLGADRRMESVGDKGEVRFVGIPADWRDRKASLALEADKYELANPDAEIALSQEAFYVAVRPKQVRLTGSVSDEQGRPIARARASIAGHAATANEDGRFEIALPADLPEAERTLTIAAPGYEPWRAQAVPGGNPLQVRLTAAGMRN